MKLPARRRRVTRKSSDVDDAVPTSGLGSSGKEGGPAFLIEEADVASDASDYGACSASDHECASGAEVERGDVQASAGALAMDCSSCFQVTKRRLEEDLDVGLLVSSV